MTKNKTSKHILSTLIVAVLLLGTITQSLHAQKTYSTKKYDPATIEKKIERIEKVRKRFNIAKIVAPIVIVTGAVLTTIIVAAAGIGLGWLFLGPIRKLSRDIAKIYPEKGTTIPLGTLKPKELIKKITNLSEPKHEQLKNITTSIKTTVQTSLEKMNLPKKIEKTALSKIKKRPMQFGFYDMKRQLKGLENDKDRTKYLQEAINTLHKLFSEIAADTLKQEKKLLTTAGILGAVIAGLAGLFSFSMIPIGTVIGLKTSYVVQAFEDLKELEQMKKDAPTLFTPQHQKVMTSFKQQLKNPQIKSFVQTFRLNNKLITTVYTLMKNSLLVKTFDNNKKARNVLTNYINARRETQLLQRTVDELGADDTKELRKLKKKLAKKKNRIKTLEASYPQLKRTRVQVAIQNYSQRADIILKELKKNLIKAVESTAFQRKLKEAQKKQLIVPL